MKLIRSQAVECSVGGNEYCGTFFLNSIEAEDFAEGLPKLIETEFNAVVHAYWFALNRYDTMGFDVSDGTLRSFGYAHEADGRQSYLDSAKDVANNSIGIDIGRQAYELGLDRSQLQAAVVSNLSSLNCISGDSFGIPVAC